MEYQKSDFLKKIQRSGIKLELRHCADLKSEQARWACYLRCPSLSRQHIRELRSRPSFLTMNRRIKLQSRSLNLGTLNLGLDLEPWTLTMLFVHKVVFFNRLSSKRVSVNRTRIRSEEPCGHLIPQTRVSFTYHPLHTSLKRRCNSNKVANNRRCVRRELSRNA